MPNIGASIGESGLHSQKTFLFFMDCLQSEVEFLQVQFNVGNETRHHVKLFGQDVISAHRLLKNDISHHEYALFTQALANEWPQASAPSWAEQEQGSQEYDVGSFRRHRGFSQR